ncbi:TPA_asm: maturation protein [ssRNA phage Gerhypos.1_4]|uniref:Maturation protein n=2 Tax=Leviviricetes TaxID=2842243 RepID=A0A8S5KXB4_9VIRU|nr:maturation protein [ssRNA phage Gerhypos.1_4]QDH89493.1 MAG: hypothetical protein H1Bulk28FD77_000001 [Leviviridae sp.]DAD50182.1 TPA_asm: maturation protein [ssRNA phage Gerhypos.1_4]
MANIPRIREFDDTRTRNLVVGLEEIKDFTPGSTKPVLSSKIFADQSSGVRRVSIDENHGRPPYRTGGGLFLYESRYATYPQGVGAPIVGRRLPDGAYGTFTQVPSTNYRRVYSGNLIPTLSSLPSYCIILGSEGIRKETDYDANVNPDDLSTLGAHAWNKLRPKVEKTNLLQDLYELKDAPGMLRSTSKGFHDLWKSVGGNANMSAQALKRLYGAEAHWKMLPKAAAEQFLNVSFGWRPFVGSIVKTCDAVLNMEQHIANLVRGNDRWINRRFAEDQVVSESIVYGSYGTSTPLVSPVFGIDYVLPFSCLFEVRRQRMSRVWYEGSFKYYRPQFDAGLQSGYPTLKKLRQMATVLGLDLNATTVYRVTPWTWLVDWFVNVGENIQSFEDMATDSVAARYAYIMRETYDRFEYRVQFKSQTGQVVEAKWYHSSSVKRRISAESPFGFTLLGGGLSAFQLSIMAALKLSGSSVGHGR